MYKYFPASPTAAAWENRLFTYDFRSVTDIVAALRERKLTMIRGRIVAIAPGETKEFLFGHLNELDWTLRDALRDGWTVRRLDLFGGFGFFAKR